MSESVQAKVSVIIPVYNAQQYLAETLESVLTQTITPLEVICIDDGSTDKSLEVLQDFANRHENIIILIQENAGSGAARNNGIKHASGKYIAFMDADDKYPEICTLEKLYEKAEQHHVHIAGGSFSDFSVYEVNRRYGGAMSAYTFSQEQMLSYTEYQFDYGYHRFIYGREFLINNNLWFPNYKRYQDPPFFVNAMIKAKVFYVIPDVTYCYRVAHKQINWSAEKANDLLAGMLDNLQTAKKHDLHKLYRLTLKRIQAEARDIIYVACCQNNKAMSALLKELQMLLSAKCLPMLEKIILYFDIQHIVKHGLKYCEKRSESKPISPFSDIKRVLNGSYIAVYGIRHTLRKFVQKIKNKQG